MSVNKFLRTMLYWLFITFIYIDIVMPGSYDFNIVAKKIIFIVFVITFLFVRATFSREILVYIAQSLFLSAVWQVTVLYWAISWEIY